MGMSDNRRRPAWRAVAVTLCHADLVGGADRHQVARLLEGPSASSAARHSGRRSCGSICCRGRALPDAERAVDDDRRRGHAVVERGHIDDRLEGRARLAQRLGGAVEVGEPMTSKPPCIARMRPSATSSTMTAADLGDRAQRPSCRASLLDDDDRAGRSALNADPPPPRRGIEASEAGSVPVVPLVKPIVAAPPLGEDDRLAPVGVAGAERRDRELARPVADDVDAEAGSRQPRPPSNWRGLRAAPSRRRRPASRGSWRCAPTGRRHRRCSGGLGELAEALDQVAADLLHEIAADVAELVVAAVADGAERRRGAAARCGSVM